MSCVGITVKGENGQVYESYQECCAAQDFAAAHQFLAKIQNSGKDSEKYKEAKEYVFKNEALYLMSQDDDTAKKRIIYLLKEEGGNNDHVSMLIDLAIENDDEAFVKTLANQYREVTVQRLKTLTTYLSSKQNDDHKKYLINLAKKLQHNKFLCDIALAYNDDRLLDEYAASYLTLYDEEVLNYLAKKNQRKYSEMIINLLTKEKSDISGKPSIGKKRFHACGSNTDEYLSSCNGYINNVDYLNDACYKVLGIAIKNKNNYLAQRATTFCMSNIEVQDVGWVNHVYIIEVSSNDQQKKNVIKTYQDAVRSGAFR